MSRACEFFGDERVPYEQLDELVESIFDASLPNLVESKMRYTDHIPDFAAHPIMEIYIGRPPAAAA